MTREALEPAQTRWSAREGHAHEEPVRAVLATPSGSERCHRNHRHRSWTREEQTGRDRRMKTRRWSHRMNCSKSRPQS